MPFRLANLLERLEQAGVAQDSWIEKILNPLVESAKNAERFKEYMYDLENRGFIAPDDYTFVFAKVV
jgi:hypothetical protein